MILSQNLFKNVQNLQSRKDSQKKVVLLSQRIKCFVIIYESK